MASVTNLTSIVNDTDYPVNFHNSEQDSPPDFTVPMLGYRFGSLWVPWVGNDGDSYKAIRVTAGKDRINIFIFQDYWNPPDLNEVKYAVGVDRFYYTTVESKKIPGDADGAGNKILRISTDDVGITLKLIQN
ncbi:hypothetical protein ACFSE0_19205 [Ochrobactrum teleogrylli]